MPRTSRRKSQLHGATACRRSSMQTSDSSCTSNDEYRMDIDDEESSFKEKLLVILLKCARRNATPNILARCFICRYVSSTLHGKMQTII